MGVSAHFLFLKTQKSTKLTTKNKNTYLKHKTLPEKQSILQLFYHFLTLKKKVFYYSTLKYKMYKVW